MHGLYINREADLTPPSLPTGIQKYILNFLVCESFQPSTTSGSGNTFIFVTQCVTYRVLGVDRWRAFIMIRSKNNATYCAIRLDNLPLGDNLFGLSCYAVKQSKVAPLKCHHL